MKTLLLVRHAKSSWDDGVSDFERPLNRRGKEDAPFMAVHIQKTGLIPDLMVSSPANRALTTAGTYATTFGLDEDLIVKESIIYNGSYKEIIKLIKNFDNKLGCVFLFGHNPDITYLANQLTGNFIDNIPTCGNVCIEFNTDSWAEISEDNGKMLFFDYPKKYKI